MQKLEQGKIDIVIGTHKIIGKDVKFKDLGLLIIDEEQKFGVGVKDKLKNKSEFEATLEKLKLKVAKIGQELNLN